MDTDQIKPDLSGWKRINDHYGRTKKEGMPKISVVIPSYNQGHSLEGTLQSYLIQKNVDKELIIIDAGSEDHTLALLEKYKEHISRVYFVTRKNLPLMINKGFSLATGEYVSYLLPGVEFLNQNCLAQMSQVAFENNRPELLFSGSYLTSPTFRKIREALKKGTDEIEPYFHYYPFNKAWLKRGFIPTAPCSIWYKTDYFLNIGGMKHNTKYIKKAVFDLLCRIYLDKNVRAVSTFWSTTSFDRRTQKKVISFRDFYIFFSVIRKYFGIFSALMWLFREKPVGIFRGVATKLRSFFKES